MNLFADTPPKSYEVVPKTDESGSPIGELLEISMGPHHPSTHGVFRMDVVLDGETVQRGVDNGSAGTWVSDTLSKTWQARHPDWPHATGAAGSANFFGFPRESQGTLMRLPELGLGPLRARDVTVLGLDQSSTALAGPPPWKNSMRMS